MMYVREVYKDFVTAVIAVARFNGIPIEVKKSQGNAIRVTCCLLRSDPFHDVLWNYMECLPSKRARRKANKKGGPHAQV